MRTSRHNSILVITIMPIFWGGRCRLCQGIRYTPWYVKISYAQILGWVTAHDRFWPKAQKNPSAGPLLSGRFHHIKLQKLKKSMCIRKYLRIVSLKNCWRFEDPSSPPQKKKPLGSRNRGSRTLSSGPWTFLIGIYSPWNFMKFNIDRFPKTVTIP